MGSDVIAPRNGVVTNYYWDTITGNTMTVYHSDLNITTLYGHLRNAWIPIGTSVSSGSLLAAIGSTGRSTGPHLHFSVYAGNVMKYNSGAQSFDPQGILYDCTLPPPTPTDENDGSTEGNGYDGDNEYFDLASAVFNPTLDEDQVDMSDIGLMIAERMMGDLKTVATVINCPENDWWCVL